MKLDKYQNKALEHAKNNQITFINGYAGSGKSAVSLEIEKALKLEGWNIDKVAPTGKAAIKIQGKTIHSWLIPEIEEDIYGNIKMIGFKKDFMDQKTCLIIDESSMIDNEIWKYIMRVFNNTQGEKKIIFVGDGGQLEPVGDGTPFINNLINNKDLTITLKGSHRQANGNDINKVANAIRMDKQIDFTPKNVKNISRYEAIRMVMEDYEKRQYIAPMKKGESGVENINNQIQSLRELTEFAYNTVKWENINDKWTIVKDKDIFIGDKIVVIKNMPSLNLFNGTIGIIIRKGIKKIMNYRTSMMEPKLGFYLKVGDKEEFITSKLASKSTDLAYALTVHKMQGSEVKEIFFATTEDQAFMLSNKKLVYTAITRASENVWLVEDK